MNNARAGTLAFGIIFLILLIFGVEFYDQVWSFPDFSPVPLMIIALVGTGIFVTVKLGFPQIRYFRHGIDVTRGIYDNPDDEGDLNHFRALTTALSATVGIGNIAGVATAIYYGGPGALFWMWVTALLGMALKYAECTLSHRYRVINEDGSASGGPMYYIEKELGANWKSIAVSFAACLVICYFCTGQNTQTNCFDLFFIPVQTGKILRKTLS